MAPPRAKPRRLARALAASGLVHALTVWALPSPDPAPEDVCVPIELALATRPPTLPETTGESTQATSRPGAATVAEAGTLGAETTPDHEAAAQALTSDSGTSDAEGPDPQRERPGALAQTRDAPEERLADAVERADDRTPVPDRPERSDPALQEFVWTDAHDLPADLTTAEAIAAHDAGDPARARPRANEGDPGPVIEGVVSTRSGTPRPVQARNNAPSALAAGDHERPEAPTEESDGIIDDPADNPAEGTGLVEREERAVAELSDEAEHTPTRSRWGEQTGTPGRTQASGDLTTRTEVPEGWAPLAVRWVGQPATLAEAGEPIPQRPEVVVTPQERLPDANRRPEQRDVPDSRDEAPSPTPAFEVAAHDAEAEPVESGGAKPAALTEPFALKRAMRASFDEASDVERASVNARATPLGEWAHRVTTELRTRWAAAELPVLDRAFGLEGTVVIAMNVSRSGRVREVTITEPSGIAAIDAHARLTIPPRLPPPPAKRGLTYQIAFEVR